MIRTRISLFSNFFLVLVLVFILGVSFTGNSQTFIRGNIFLDKNENGKKDDIEKGISNVAISNGEKVVASDDLGNYKLPVSGETVIFVIKPSGYRISGGKDRNAEFYYLHKPEGSPEAKYPGVDPTGNLPKEINFGLVPQEEKENYTALIFGDPQPRNLEEIGYFEESVIKDIDKNKDIAFGISLGDLVWNNLDLFEPYKKAISELNIPWYNVMGNHDMNLDAEREEDSDETFEAYFGPATYSYNYAKTHILILDDILFPDPRDGEGYWGGFTDKQLRFIENDLKLVPQDYLVILNFHIPISEPDGDSFRDEDRQKLFELLMDFENTLSISAHTHIQRQNFFGSENGWKGKELHHHFNAGTTCGDWNSGKLIRWGATSGYARWNSTRLCLFKG